LTIIEAIGLCLLREKPPLLFFPPAVFLVPSILPTFALWAAESLKRLSRGWSISTSHKILNHQYQAISANTQDVLLSIAGV
jgi:hypothetical protein